MISALAYLQFTTWVNTYRQKLQRLKQPRYLAGAIVGVGYFYFFFFRRLVGAPSTMGGVSPFSFAGGEKFEPIAAAVLLIYLAAMWIFPSAKAALVFTEAEVAFLFPAPITRRNLIHFKLLSSQFKILVSAAFFALVAQRWSTLSGSYLIHFVGWWLVLAFINLHTVAAAFTRERLLGLGVNSVQRRIGAALLLLIVVGVSWFWIRGKVSLLADSSDASGLLAGANAILASPPLAWLLLPLRLVIRPGLAIDTSSFLRAIGPAILMLGLEYVWVLRAEVSFEEASLVTAQRVGERLAAIQSGKLRMPAPKQARKEPFVLRPTGPKVLAFLWKNLIALGPLSYPRVGLISALVLIGGMRWLVHQPEYLSFARTIGVFAGIAAAYGLIFCPMIARRSSERLIEQIDLMKAFPLRGWEIVLGELLTPIVILTVFEWIMLSVITLAVRDAGGSSFLPVALVASGSIGIGMVVPFLGGLLFALNIVGVLLFPAWNATGAQAGSAVDRIGQRMIFLAGYLLIAIVALLPAGACASFVLLALKYLFENTALGLVLAGATAAFVLAGESAVTLWWLGKRYEKFDLSAELPK